MDVEQEVKNLLRDVPELDYFWAKMLVMNHARKNGLEIMRGAESLEPPGREAASPLLFSKLICGNSDSAPNTVSLTEQESTSLQSPGSPTSESSKSGVEALALTPLTSPKDCPYS